MKGYPTLVTVRPARYSRFDPDRWWKTRGGVRAGITEFQKLVLEVILHPIAFSDQTLREPVSRRI
jgi:hypothetical protein